MFYAQDEKGDSCPHEDDGSGRGCLPGRLRPHRARRRRDPNEAPSSPLSFVIVVCFVFCIKTFFIKGLLSCVTPEKTTDCTMKCY
ncbi:UNVERIFIED_CONTAM: hypothetical protein NCL1_21708 [Trichonephila clavipes]